MPANDILNAITTVGFPIVMCIACAWFIKYTTDKHRDEVNDLNKAHAQEMDKVTQAINNNTIALTKLLERMDQV